MRRYLFTILICLFAWTAHAQQRIVVPYMCGFEDEEDLSQWVLNAEGTNVDKWIVGNMTHSEGKKSLYITSGDNNYTYYGASPNISVAYLKVMFPQTPAGKQGNYDLSFDWRCEGGVSSKLYFMAVPLSQLNDPTSPVYINKIVSNTSGKLPLTILNQCLTFSNGQKELYGSTVWKNISLGKKIGVSSQLTNEIYALVFIWCNDNHDESVSGVSICIDNLQIASANVRKPENVEVETYCEDSALSVSWDCTADNYIVEYRKSGTQTWRRIDEITENTIGYSISGTRSTYNINNIDEGTYDVRVQGRLNGEISAYSLSYLNLMYCPDNHCINYMNLTGPNVTCYYGMNNPNDQSSPYTSVGALDYGSSTMESRHTVHLDQNEYDMNTGYKLKVIPDGALGVVRLGNWNIGAEAEAVEYSFVVDSAMQGILLVKYAIVMEDPGHDEIAQPRFLLEIIDEKGRVIDTDCGYADFAADKSREGWHVEEGGNTPVVWKDWTTVGVGLQKYDGQTLKVRLTTFDCSQTGHFGYAYFILDCINAFIETENCGNDPQIHCQAPEGFKYYWTDENGNFISDSATLIVDAGRHEYTCRASYLEDDSCYILLKTTSAPRFPVPGISHAWTPANCKNIVSFDNSAHVMNRYDGYDKHNYTEKCNEVKWVFTSLTSGKSSTTTNPRPTYVADINGDSVRVDFICYIGEENSCDSALTEIVYVPSIYTGDTTIRKDICNGSGFLFDGEWRTEEGIYVQTIPNFADCDSVVTLDLRLHDASPEETRDITICSDDFYNVGGINYNQTGSYACFMSNTWGCDSIVNLNLSVIQKVRNAAFVNNEPYVVCHDDQQLCIIFSCNLDEAPIDKIEVNFSPESHAAGLKDTTLLAEDLTDISDNLLYIYIPFDESVKPGYYALTLTTYQPCCGTQTIPLNVNIYYDKAIMAQKWNNVIALYDSRFNGGYTFTAYQWYMNGQPIPGATGPYLYQNLDNNANYQVLLTRDDGVQILTCEMQPTMHTDSQTFPSVAKAGARIPMHLSADAIVNIYTVLGQIYSSVKLNEGNEIVVAPVGKGMYILDVAYSNGEHVSQNLLVY